MCKCCCNQFKSISYSKLRPSITWYTDCKVINITTMSESHINNILKMYKNHCQHDCYHGRMVKEWVLIFKTELKFRQSLNKIDQTYHQYLLARAKHTQTFQ